MATTPTPASALLPDPFGLRNLNQLVDENIAGLQAIWYTEASNLLTWPEVGALLIEQTLLLKPGATWYQLLSTRGSMRYKATPKDLGRHGSGFTHKLTGALAKHTEGLAAGLETLGGRRLVLLYRDLNGQVQLVGTPEQPCEFKDSYDSGDQPFGNRNGYDFTISAETARRARPYRGTWAVSGLGLQYAVELQQGNGGSVELRTAGGVLLATVLAGKTVILKSGFRLNFQVQ
ncbi:hypothetical protein [Hymenobacter algoricola]|uniref:Uncharacterized protein n=1 Tax=Hymenobacter algoricola TaxID=486267 RepID=A0ABP7NU70_9BACT